MKYFLITTALIIALCFVYFLFKNKMAIQAGNTKDAIQNTVALNQKAKEELETLRLKAHSPNALEFIRLTEKQNELAEKSIHYTKQIQTYAKQLTPAIQNDQAKWTAAVVPLCRLEKEYIPIFSDIVSTIHAKLNLLNENPAVSNELFADQRNEVTTALTKLADIQNKMLEAEKQAYIQLDCENYIAYAEQNNH